MNSRNNDTRTVILKPPLPSIYPYALERVIAHPALMLWDSWACDRSGVWYLYCLALAKKDIDGNHIQPSERNNYQFHIRQFTSDDMGGTWWDKGVFMTPQMVSSDFAKRNIWSGSALPLQDGRMLMSFTGIREVSEEQPFIQSLGLAISKDGLSVASIQEIPLSCPLRDYDEILSLGYYLGPKDQLGHREGEEGGPILAWRDPYLLPSGDGSIDVFWSAKTSPKVGAIAHATMIEKQNGFVISELHSPITLPDSHLFTQAELPKIYLDTKTGTYFCFVAACDRLYEGQDDNEVHKLTRLYTATQVRGPWYPWQSGNSEVLGLDGLFGGSIVEENYAECSFTMIAPYTEMVGPPLELTFAAVKKISYQKTSE